jgi:hypothetical protein
VCLHYRRVSLGRAFLEFRRAWRDSRQPAAFLRQRVGIGKTMPSRLSWGSAWPEFRMRYRGN